MADKAKEIDIDPKVLVQPNFIINDVEFSIVKMRSMEGWKVMEQIRFTLGQKDIKIDPSLDGNAFLATVLEAIIKMEPTFTDWLRQQLFRGISYQISGTTSYQPLLGAEDTAFEHLEPYHVYELIMRGLAVNFTSSFLEIQSRVLGVQKKAPGDT